MGKSTGHKELALVLAGKFHSHILQEGGAALTKVYRHIQHTALDDTHQFGLAELAFLIMQSAQHATGAFGFVVLYKRHGSHHTVKLVLTKSFHEITACVAKYFGFQHKHAFYLGFYVFHFLNKYKPAQR